MTASGSLSAFLDDARARIDEALDLFLPRPPDVPALVSDAVRYSVFAGGKRLRPCLTLAAADAIAPDFTALALPAACAIEMIHTYSLIHDDLPAMDNDSLRRGRSTLHVVYGEGIAILAGDALHAEGFTLLASAPAVHDEDTRARKLRVIQVIGHAAGSAGMVGGQTIDLQAAGQVPDHPVTLDSAALRDMHARKTGVLIRAAAVCGAIMAGGDDRTIEALDRYATDLGLAFQIVDDILDVEGNAAELGKTAGKDASADKPTYPSLFGITESRALARECVDRAKQTLVDEALTRGWLAAIADWVASRKN